MKPLAARPMLTSLLRTRWCAAVLELVAHFKMLISLGYKSINSCVYTACHHVRSHHSLACCYRRVESSDRKASVSQTNCPASVSAACGGYNSARTTDNAPMLHNGAPVLQNVKNADVFMWCAAAPLPRNNTHCMHVSVPVIGAGSTRNPASQRMLAG